MTSYDILHHLSLHWLIVTYFFLGGLAAGSFLFSVAANYWKKEFKPMAKSAAVLSLISAAAGAACLNLELGKPFRVWRLFLNFSSSSIISWGVWFLSIFIFLGFLYTLFLFKNDDGKAQKIAYLGIPFAVLVAIYSSLMLAQMPGKALWNSALLPWLFLNGGIVSGIALIILISAGRQEGGLVAKLSKLAAWLIVLELAMVTTEIVFLLNGSPEELNAAKFLMTGNYSFMFWIVQILLGCIVPAVILLRSKVTARMQSVASVLILVGVFVMRYIIVIGGQVIH